MSTYKGFSEVKLARPKRSTFDLSHEKRLTTVFGQLTPVFISETMPNDTFNVKTEVMLRLAPMLAPIMHRINVFVHYFFVPNRLLWKDWELFITGGRLGTETPPVPPYIDIQNVINGGSQHLFHKNTLADYLGIMLNLPIPGTPETGWDGIKLAAMPFMAYQKIWYDYFRDRNFQTNTLMEELPFSSGLMSQSRSISAMTRRFRCWQHDYFTSALPWTQRGAEVLMPVDMEISYKPVSDLVRFQDDLPAYDNPASYASGALLDPESGDQSALRVENLDSVTNTSVTINDLRRAVALQKWLERNALAGSRYNESIMAHFGRKTSDSRLQRAEYLGGGKVPVKISEVLNTAWSQDGAANDVPPATMSGHGLSFGNTNRFSYNCEEHGFVIGLMSIMPVTSYMQGIPRMFRHRNTFLDYPWPTFAHLGEQEVYISELYAKQSTLTVNAQDEEVFGYQSRYADWKYIPSSSHGEFLDTLDFWHLTRLFASKPVLGISFNQYDVGLENRIFAVDSTTPNCWVYLYNDVRVKRALPYYGTPML